MVEKQLIHERYAIYLGDCIEVMDRMPQACVHLSIYSPPFCGLYHYSSNPRDLSNSDSYDKFFEQYTFVVNNLHRMTLPGRISLVHCVDVPLSNTGVDKLKDFPGDIIRLHERIGWDYCGRHCVWKEPLGVRNRTMQKNLAHQTIVEDSSLCSVASADYLLIFRRSGENPIPIAHPHGLTSYAGERIMPAELQAYRGWTGKQTENRFSHWIWRQYASAFWDDVRIDRVLPFKASRDQEDEKHVHPLQLDVIERGVVLRSNPGETIFTPFLGVGSEVYGALINGRRGVGIELKPSYFNQAVKNIKHAVEHGELKEDELPLETVAL